MSKERACANGPAMSRRTLLTALPASGVALALPSPIFAETEAPAEPDPILSLPFVRDTTRAERRTGMPPRIFWAVEPSGDYTADCDTGSHFGHLAISYMVEHNFASLLGWAVFDMMRAGPERSGIEACFLAVLARHSMMGKRLSDELLARA